MKGPTSTKVGSRVSKKDPDETRTTIGLATNDEITFLRRYTDLPAALCLLRKQKITLLDPSSWDDSNDSHYLTLYREKKGLTSVLALCFTQANETYHHWRIFANGPSGICVVFNRDQLVNIINRWPGVRSDYVHYLTLKQMRLRRLNTDDLPFLKRYAYEHEAEFRIIYQSTTEAVTSLDIRVPLSCIDHITLSPWIDRALFEHVKKTLQSVRGCRDLVIKRSTLISNQEWKNFGESAK